MPKSLVTIDLSEGWHETLDELYSSARLTNLILLRSLLLKQA